MKVLQASQLVVHETLEGARGVSQPEGHDFEFIQAPLASKGSPVLVRGLNLYLVVALLQVQTGEHLASMQAIEEFINAWQGVSVQTRVGVK